jgi:ABC-2 type transport system ATP-binding protein
MVTENLEMSENAAIIIQELIKRYGKVEALRGVDLEVQRGEIFGFLGPNGAGKTTTIRCLLDLIRPSSGKISVLGINPQVDPVAVQARVGYLPGELSLTNNWTAKHQLRFFADMRGGKVDQAYMQELAERLELDLSRPIKNLSKGNKQKVGVVQALMHHPELLLLDEPTGGLDPLMQREVLALICQARADGATVFFSSHIISEVEAVADRVAIIRQGKIIEVAETASLAKRALRHVAVSFERPVDKSVLSQIEGVKVLSQADGTEVTLEVQGQMDSLIKTLATFPVDDMETTRPSLEEVFLAYYEN